MMQNKNHIQYQSSPEFHYDQLRLARVRQQRQRMQHMKEVIDNYSDVISHLQQQNKQLLIRNQQYQEQLDKAYQINQQIKQFNKQLHRNLQFEKEMKRNCENTIRQLKQDIAILSIRQQKQFQRQEKIAQDNIEQQNDAYSNLYQSYQQLKKQYFLISQENAELKQIIKQKQPMLQKYGKNQRSEQFGKIRTYPNKKKIKQDQKQSLQQSLQGQHSEYTTQQSIHLKQKIKLLQRQTKKQQKLIEKFHVTERQQQQLIQILKNQKSKVCLCHTYGHGTKSSGRIKTEKSIALKSIQKIQEKPAQKQYSILDYENA